MTAIVINDLDHYRRPLDSDSEFPVEGDRERTFIEGRLWLRVSDTDREKVVHKFAKPNSWAWVVSRRDDLGETLVEFPQTERTGWYKNEDLVAVL